MDFVKRTGLTRPALRQLAIAGAFNCFGLRRRDALWKIEALSNRNPNELEIVPFEEPAVFSNMKPSEILLAEYVGLGFSAGHHPMRLLRRHLHKMRVTSAVDLKKTAGGKNVKVAGIVIVKQQPATAKGFVFITLEDETGLTNVVIKPKLAEEYRKELVKSPVLLVEGKLQRNGEIINILGDRFTPLRFPKDVVEFR